MTPPRQHRGRVRLGHTSPDDKAAGVVWARKKCRSSGFGQPEDGEGDCEPGQVVDMMDVMACEDAGTDPPGAEGGPQLLHLWLGSEGPGRPPLRPHTQKHDRRKPRHKPSPTMASGGMVTPLQELLAHLPPSPPQASQPPSQDKENMPPTCAGGGDVAMDGTWAELDELVASMPLALPPITPQHPPAHMPQPAPAPTPQHTPGLQAPVPRLFAGPGLPPAGRAPVSNGWQRHNSWSGPTPRPRPPPPPHRGSPLLARRHSGPEPPGSPFVAGPWQPMAITPAPALAQGGGQQAAARGAEGCEQGADEGSMECSQEVLLAIKKKRAAALRRKRQRERLLLTQQ